MRLGRLWLSLARRGSPCGPPFPSRCERSILLPVRSKGAVKVLLRIWQLLVAARLFTEPRKRGVFGSSPRERQVWSGRLSEGASPCARFVGLARFPRTQAGPPRGGPAPGRPTVW